jgi:hypothetical protein
LGAQVSPHAGAQGAAAAQGAGQAGWQAAGAAQHFGASQQAGAQQAFTLQPNFLKLNFRHFGAQVSPQAGAQGAGAAQGAGQAGWQAAGAQQAGSQLFDRWKAPAGAEALIARAIAPIAANKTRRFMETLLVRNNRVGCRHKMAQLGVLGPI